MTLLVKRTLVVALAIALSISSLSTATAQSGKSGEPAGKSGEPGLKPVAVVSIVSIKEMLNDIGYVTRIAGMADQGDTARFFASAMTSGIDKERPIGLYFVPKNGEFHTIAFVPMDKDGLNTILKLHKDQLGEAKDAGDGVLQVGRARTVFVKDQNGWAFVSENKQHLADLPQDPASLLGDLPKHYNVAAKLFVQNIPAELRKTAIDEIKLGIERFLDSPAARQQKIDRDQAKQLTKVYTTQLEKLINEADELMIGLGINEQAKDVVLDVAFSAKGGTSLARAMALQADAKTNFAGFVQPDAAMTMTLASKTSPEDIAQASAALQLYRTQIAKAIDDSADVPPNKRDAIKALLGPLFDVIGKTIATGRADGGAIVMLQPKSCSFAFGGAMADGPSMEKILAQVGDLIKDLPNAPKLQLNTGTVGDMKLSRLTAPIPAQAGDMREVFGENLEILIGISPKSFIVAGGKSAEELLKSVLQKSSQESEKSVSPLDLTISLLPILKFSKSIDSDNPVVSRMVSSLEQGGNDRVSITNKGTTTSSTTRIEIQEGVIRAGGEGFKAGQAARVNRGAR
ncbi:MAG TPA: hypothetical protein VGI40_19955 [Pirellulaceae bacterium]